MPNYSASGTEKLRGDPKVYAASPNASPSGKGSDAGGTENKQANAQVKHAEGNSSPTGGTNRCPAQSFNGEAV